MNPEHQRRPEADVDAQFVERWSPRAFSEKPVEPEKIRSLFEAARWAPSSGNEQPWLFLFPEQKEELASFRSLLNPSNLRWAQRAPLLLFLLGRRKWSKSGRDNYTFQFDCGSAFMSLALQAHRLGLFAHPMAGFDREKAYEVLRVDREAMDIIIAIAIGYYGDKQLLPEDLQEREKPSLRKELHLIYQRPSLPL